MGDIRDWAALLRGRWNWQKFGYEENFPRRCGFTDVDAATEFDGLSLLIETKQHDGIGPCPYPDDGQMSYLRDEVRRGKTVFVLYGCGVCNSPQALRIIGPQRDDDQWLDWRELEIEERRKRLKEQIERAMGLR